MNHRTGKDYTFYWPGQIRIPKDEDDAIRYADTWMSYTDPDPNKYDEKIDAEAKRVAAILIRSCGITPKRKLTFKLEVMKWKKILIVLSKPGYDFKRPILAAKRKMIKHVSEYSSEFQSFDDGLSTLLSFRYLGIKRLADDYIHNPNNIRYTRQINENISEVFSFDEIFIKV